MLRPVLAASAFVLLSGCSVIEGWFSPPAPPAVADAADTAAWSKYVPWNSAAKNVVKTGSGVEYIVLASGPADGALPGSFSNECLGDMLAFKAKLLRKAELIRGRAEQYDEEEVSEENGSLTLNFIDIEQGGHGFSRPITVRIFE